MANEKQSPDTLNVFMLLEGKPPGVAAGFAEIERRICAALVNPLSLVRVPLHPLAVREEAVEAAVLVVGRHVEAARRGARASPEFPGTGGPRKPR